jgi:hypothetical protein
MKKWYAKTIGDCDVHRDIYEEGNPKPIAEHIMFDAANALVAAHNGEQERILSTLGRTYERNTDPTRPVTIRDRRNRKR